MKILAIRPTPPGAGSTVLAHFDAEITPEFRIYCLALRLHHDGTYRISAPNAYGRRVATFTKEFAHRLVTAASLALLELNANDDNIAA
jgi:hypothetical protein